MDEDLTAYRIPEPANAITAFVDDLSNWYVRRGRERFWGKGMDDTKEAAFVTLYTVLTTLAKVIAPFVPFMSEDMYQNLVRTVYPDAPESVHLCLFPTADESLIDENLNRQMDAALDVVSLGRACRNAANLKVRQPLSALYVKGVKLDEAFVELAADELNVKTVVFTDDARAFTTYNLKPQMRTLGPKYGKALLGKIGGWLKEADGNVWWMPLPAAKRYALRWTVQRSRWRRTMCLPKPFINPALPARWMGRLRWCSIATLRRS